jgi:hypothetical protein
MFQEEGLGSKAGQVRAQPHVPKNLSAKPNARILPGHLKLLILETISAKRYRITANRPAGAAEHWTPEVGQASFATALKYCTSNEVT